AVREASGAIDVGMGRRSATICSGSAAAVGSSPRSEAARLTLQVRGANRRRSVMRHLTFARALLGFLLTAAVRPAARAAYVSDGEALGLSRGGSMGTQIIRLYVGRESINDCPIPADLCRRYRGEPSEVRRPAPGEEHLIYRGRKTLYRGTGAAHASVGP